MILKKGCEIGVRVTFNALVLTKSSQMSARNEGNLKFVIFIWNQDLRKGCEIGVRGTFNALCGLVEQCRTPVRQTVSSSLASANVFVSLGKILSLDCFVDLSVIR